jgi:hypothetical protein
MHHAGVFLAFLMLLLLLLLNLVLVMGFLRDSNVSHGHHKCARDYGCNVFSHFVWL